jgi:hypothetical protein
MTQSIKAENSLLKDDERDLVSKTHFPSILDSNDESLIDLLKRVRAFAEKERALVHHVRRSIRGKADPRGASSPGDVERASRRKQVFASATKRANKEIARRRALAAREALKASARRALTLKQNSTLPTPPDSGQNGSEGMASLENRKRRWVLDRARVGRVSQAGKRAQVARDARLG